MIDVPVIILQWWLKMTLDGCILMMCVLVRSHTTFQDLLHSHLMAVFLQFLNIVHLEFITICKQCEIYMKSIFVLRLQMKVKSDHRSKFSYLSNWKD